MFHIFTKTMDRLETDYPKIYDYPKVMDVIESYHTRYKVTASTFKENLRTEIYGYLNGLRDAGIVSELERRILYTYATIG